jgi:DHA2 family multidrug resistance protein-like MFS transporter
MTAVVAGPGERAGAREWAGLAVLSLVVLLVAVDATVLGLALPFLAADLAPSAGQLLWIGDAYSFVLAGLLVTAGAVGDRIGRKRLLLVGVLGFGAVSTAAAYAPTAEALIVLRALLGVAGATLMPSTLSIVRNMFADARQRTLAVGVWSATAGAGAALGPVVGGALLERYWWGSVFLINLPVLVVLLVAGVAVLPESRDPDPGPFDVPGAALSLVGVVGLVYAVKEAATGGPAVTAVAAALAGAGALAAFVARQRRRPVPMIDVELLRRPAFAGAVTANLLAIFALAGLLFFVAQYLQLVLGYRPLRAGLAELPATAGSILGGLAAAWLVRRAGRATVTAAGLAVTAAALAALAGLESGHGGYLLLGTALGVAGLGAGLALTVTTDSVVSAVPKEKAGAASAVSETAYELGTALGIGVLGSVLTAVYRSALPAGAPAAVRESLATAVAAGVPLDAARAAFVTGMRVTTLVGAVLTAAAAVAAALMLPRRSAGSE